MVPSQVMPIVPMAHLLGEAVLAEVTEADRVLDTGTGSGVNAILAASRSLNVVAVDINPHALAAAQDNAVRNGVAERIKVRHSDVFKNVDGAFDLITFFGSSGDVAYLQELIDHEGFRREVLAQHSLVNDGWQVDYFTFRLTV